MQSNKSFILVTVAVAFLLCACAAKQKNILESSDSQVRLRSIQSRIFETTDRNRLLRAVIATLQDLGFVIEDANAALGTVTGTKRNLYTLRITVSIRQKGTHQMIVRSSAQYNLLTIEEPETYQQFFAALSKSLFLEGNQIH